ncbi:MAG: aminopeptidase P family protein [Myxococcota bacterium]
MSTSTPRGSAPFASGAQAPRTSPEALKERRERLGAQLGRTAAILPAGSPPPRNYTANVYPFRAASHFLYLAGEAIENAWLSYGGNDPADWTLYVPAPDADDALWHGERPSRESLEAQAGCRIAYGTPGDARGAATVPAPGHHTQLEQARLVGDGGVNDALIAALIDLRSVHDAAAIDQLRAAANATIAAHVAGMAATTPGTPEYAICAAMEHALHMRGMGTAYSPIVTVHGEVLHNHHHGGVCADGDLLLADVGAETPEGWAGDVTRTWPVSGRFSPTQRDVYELILQSQLDAIAEVRPGARYRDVHLRACRTLTAGLVELGILRGDPDSLVERGVHALFFPHGVGHLIGLDVHDMEDLGDRAGYDAGFERSEQFGLSFLRLDRTLKPRMAVTIEPGFYQVPAILHDKERCAFAEDAINRDRLAAFADVRGIRIEDDVLVTEGAPEVLTDQAPKNVQDVEAVVGG